MKGIFFNGDLRQTYIAQILRELYVDKVFDVFMVGKKGLTVVDVGANVGLTSLYFSQYADKVIAVEPTESHFACLEKMIEFNELKDKIIPMRNAIGVEGGKREFHHSKNSTMNSLSPLVNDTGEKEMVEVITLEQVFEQQNLDEVDFMKIDIEGSEVELIASESFARVAERIKALSVEYHTWSNRNRGQIVQALEGYGFTIKTLSTEADLYLAVRL